MAVKIRVKLNRAGFNAIRNSDEVVELLEEIGDRIADSATAQTRFNIDGTPPFYVNTVHNDSRAVVFVGTANLDGMLAEVHDRALSKAFAAQGGTINPGSERDLVDYIRKDGKKIRVTRLQAHNYSRGRQ